MIKVFFKYQIKYFLFLCLVFVLPLVLFNEFSPYDLKFIEYTFLGILVISQFVFFNEVDFKKKNEVLIKKGLGKEIGRVPSKSDIVKRLQELTSSRGLAIGLCIILIISLIIYYQKI